MKAEMILKILIAGALLSALSACGNKKDSEPPLVAPTTTLAPPPPPHADDDTIKPKDGPEAPPSEVPGPRTAPPAPKPPGTGSNPSQNDSKEIIYSGAANDQLRTELINKMKSGRQDMQEPNAKLAQRIVDAFYSIEIGQASNPVTVHLFVEQADKSIAKVVLQGSLDAKHTGSLVASKANQLANETVTGTLTCMDEDSRYCQTASLFVEFQAQGQAKEKAPVARVILRQSYINLVTNVVGEYSKSEAANKFIDMLTVGNFDGVSSMIQSFEVINGLSGFRTILKSQANQVIGFRSLLAISEEPVQAKPMMNKEELSILINSTRSEAFDGGDIRFDVMHSLTQVSVVKNDGQGGLVVQMVVKSADGREDTFELDINRILGKVKKFN